MAGRDIALERVIVVVEVVQAHRAKGSRDARHGRLGGGFFRFRVLRTVRGRFFGFDRAGFGPQRFEVRGGKGQRVERRRRFGRLVSLKSFRLESDRGEVFTSVGRLFGVGCDFGQDGRRSSSGLADLLAALGHGEAEALEQFNGRLVLRHCSLLRPRGAGA